MADITNVNLTFLRKVRGVAPLSRFAVRDDASLVISAPDEMEVRTFHLARFQGPGRAQRLETYSVETLRKTEIAAEGKAFVGITDDDLYLFRQAHKSRFLADRRASFIDVALGEEGQRFATAFSDLLQSGHTIALGDVSGRLLWTKDIPFPVARIGVDRNVSHVAIAGDTGDLLLLDASRQTIWSHHQETPIRAVATNGPACTIFACGGEEIENGGVGMIGDDGTLRWFAALVGTPLEVALDAAGETIAVLSQFDASTGRLVFLSREGLPTWDIDYDEARPTGLSLSASGRFAAVTLRDGHLGMYELQHGERLASLTEDAVLAEVHAALGAENLRLAIETLRMRLSATPSDLRACALLGETLKRFRALCLATAGAAEALGDWAAADARLADAIAAHPGDSDLVAQRHSLRQRWGAAMRAAATDAAARGDGAEAEAALLSAIEADPLDAAAREALGDVRFAASKAALALGKERLEQGDATAALEALAEARRRGAGGPEWGEMVRCARIVEALSLGNALYQDRQYAAALFQYKKVLRLEPEHPEALQKVSYAQNFLQDTQLNDRFSRLE